MTHPTDLLADYVDGTLPAAERRRVDSHLASCKLCAAEVEDATKGRSALSSLPRVEVPVGVTSPVLRQARGTSGAGSPTTTAPAKMKFRMGRVYGLVAASVAALLAVVFVLGGHRSPVVSTGARAEMALPVTDMHKGDNEPGPLDLDGDYSASELSAFVDAEAQQRSGVKVPAPADQVAGGSAYASDAPTADSGGLSGGSLPASKKALQKSQDQTSPVTDPGKLERCLKSIDAYANGGTSAGNFEALYDGIPAYFAVLLEGPEPGQPADKVIVWVVARSNCDVVAFAQQAYPLATPSPLPTTFFEP